MAAARGNALGVIAEVAAEAGVPKVRLVFHSIEDVVASLNNVVYVLG